MSNKVIKGTVYHQDYALYYEVEKYRPQGADGVSILWQQAYKETMPIDAAEISTEVLKNLSSKMLDAVYDVK